MKHHLKDAEMHIERAVYGKIDRSEFNAQLAIAHALVAWVERMDKAINLLAELAEARKHKIEQEENRDYNEYR